MEKSAIDRLEQLIHQAASKSFDIGVSMAIIQTAINDNALVGDNKIPANELKHKMLIETKELWDTMLSMCGALGELQREIRLLHSNDDIKKAIRFLEDIACDLEATDVYGRNKVKVLLHASEILDEIRKKA